MRRTVLIAGLVVVAVACANAGARVAHATDARAADIRATDGGEADLVEFKAAPPSLGVAQGGALVGLARSAMARYIKARTPADAQVLGPEASGLSGSPLCAAVTLRKDGGVVGRSIQTGPSLVRNVILGALEAMRSPELPNRVTEAFLDSCTLEVEVLGAPRALGNGPEPALAGQNQSTYQKEVARFGERLNAAINPGLTGLLLVRGEKRPDGCPNGRAYVLPSEAYEHSLSPSDMSLNCRMKLSGEARGPLEWSIFLTMHFVGYPDGRIVYLSRGKMLMPPEMIDEKTLHDGAVSVGNFLWRHQVRQTDAETRRHGDAETQAVAGLAGAYIVDGARPSMVDQAHAAYAMSLLAQKTGNKEFAASAKAAVGYLQTFVKQDERRAAWLTWPGASEQEEIAATAWWKMAVETGQPDTLPVAAVAFLSRSLSNLPAATSKPTSAPGSESRPSRSPAGDVFLGFYAMEHGMRVDDAGVRARVQGIEPTDLWAGLWKARAGLDGRPVGEIVAGFGGRILGEDGPLDEVGGVRPKDGYALTELSALLAMAELAPGDIQTLLSRTSGTDHHDLAARRFCYQMTYRPREGYFAERPEDLVGGVRGSPISAQIRLSACAATIEAIVEAQYAQYP